MFSIKVFLSSASHQISWLVSSSSFVAFWRFKRVHWLLVPEWHPFLPLARAQCRRSVLCESFDSLAKCCLWNSFPNFISVTDDSPSVSSSQGRSSSSSALSFYSSLPSLGCRWCPWCGYYRRLDGYYMPCRVIQTGAHLMIRKTKTTTSLFV